MVESLKELNRICQKPRYKEEGNWMVRTFLRDLALPVTWCLLHTSITANQVTLLSLAVALLGVLFLSLPGTFSFLTGVILLQLWYLLDHVDGQIARYRKSASLTGRFFDFITHHIVHGALFFGLGFFAYRLTGRVFYIALGFLASISITSFNLIHDTKYKTFFEGLRKLPRFRLRAPSETDAPPKEAESAPPERDWKKRVFSFLHKLCEIHVVMNILTASVLIEILWGHNGPARICLFWFYSLILPVLTAVKITYIIRNQTIDREFAQNFYEPEP